MSSYVLVQTIHRSRYIGGQDTRGATAGVKSAEDQRIRDHCETLGNPSEVHQEKRTNGGAWLTVMRRGRHAPLRRAWGWSPICGWSGWRQTDAVNASICLTQSLYQVQTSDDQHEDRDTDDNARQYGAYPSLSKNPQERELTYQSTFTKRGGVIFHLWEAIKFN